MLFNVSIPITLHIEGLNVKRSKGSFTYDVITLGGGEGVSK